jgi:hypothetical protein
MRTKPPLGHNSGGFSFGSVGTFGAGRTRVLGLWRASPNAPQRRRQAARASGVSFGLPPRGRQAVVSLVFIDTNQGAKRSQVQLHAMERDDWL